MLINIKEFKGYLGGIFIIYMKRKKKWEIFRLVIYLKRCEEWFVISECVWDLEWGK